MRFVAFIGIGLQCHSRILCLQVKSRMNETRLDDKRKEQWFNRGTITRWRVGIVRLGKMHLRWCGACNVPVLEAEQCGRCGCATTPVEMTPPGDARPAFEHDIDFLRSLLDAQFGMGPACGSYPMAR